MTDSLNSDTWVTYKSQSIESTNEPNRIALELTRPVSEERNVKYRFLAQIGELHPTNEPSLTDQLWCIRMERKQFELERQSNAEVN